MDLEGVIVSHRDERWLARCVESLEDATGACAYRATIVESGRSQISLPTTPTVRVLYTPNRGFGAANNAGAIGSDAVINHLLRLAVLRFRGATESSSAPASALALRVLLGASAPPFGPRNAESAVDGSSGL